MRLDKHCVGYRIDLSSCHGNFDGGYFMLELIGAVIEKLAELLLERKLDKDKNKEQGGCARMFQLYCQLELVICSSENVCEQLEFYSSTPSNSYLRHIFVDIKELTKHSADFMEKVHHISDSIMIYDEKLSSELERIVQAKINLLGILYDKLPDPYSTPLREEFITLKKKVKDFKIDFSQFDVGDFRRVHLEQLLEVKRPMQVTPFKAMKKTKGVQIETVDFNKKENVLSFVAQAKHNIEVFQETKKKLRLFIQKNCKYDDLFQ